MTYKLCTACKQMQPETFFPLNRSKRDGRGSWCKSCDKRCHNAARTSRRTLGRPEPFTSHGAHLRHLHESLRRLTFVRCSLPLQHHAAIEGRYVECAHPIVCGGLVLVGRELQHMRDVHGLDEVPSGAFAPAADVGDYMVAR